MTVPAPNLDDRRFQQLVDEAKLYVQQACPQWTDHNVSDPGVVLIELFAGMTDQVIYRLNQVPDHLYRRFLSLIGVSPHPPRTAVADVTFLLSAPQPATVRVPRGAQVATKREPDRPQVEFVVVDELGIVPCELESIGIAGPGGEIADRTSDASAGTAFSPFSQPPQPGESLHVELSAAVPSCTVRLELECDDAYGHGVDPERPPFVWEAWSGEEWIAADFEDETKALNRSGHIVVHVPAGAPGTSPTRLRCRLIEGDMPAYAEPPRISRVRAATVGGTTRAIHGELVEGELLGKSTGQPSQRFRVQRPPIVSHDRLVVECRHGDVVEEYVEVDGFADSDARSPHFTVDRTDGEVVFGPALRDGDEQRDAKREGKARQHGKIPPRGALLVVRGYLTGGGPAGNVAASELQVLKGTIPFVARVRNRRRATGGAPPETVAEACARGPIEFRRRERAVTADDYEHFALRADDRVARARCLPPPPDAPAMPASIVVVPRLSESAQPPTPEDLVVPLETKVAVREELDERRVLGARFEVRDADYQAVRVDALVRVLPGRGEREVRERCKEALHRYFHPTRGGGDGGGWPWGRAVYSGMAYVVLERVEGVDIVQELKLYPTELEEQRTGKATERIALRPDQLVVSADHNVAAISGEGEERG